MYENNKFPPIPTLFLSSEQKGNKALRDCIQIKCSFRTVRDSLRWRLRRDLWDPWILVKSLQPCGTSLPVDKNAGPYD